MMIMMMMMLIEVWMVGEAVGAREGKVGLGGDEGAGCVDWKA